MFFGTAQTAPMPLGCTAVADRRRLRPHPTKTSAITLLSSCLLDGTAAAAAAAAASVPGAACVAPAVAFGSLLDKATGGSDGEYCKKR
jgi:hypothetical protein